MTVPVYFSYIGDANSPGFFWDDIPEDAGRSGNTPRRIIPKEFSLGLGFSPEIVEWGKQKGLEGKQLDWGAWGLRLSKADLEMIWKERKKGRWVDEKEWNEIWAQIEALAEDGKYVLVVAESIF